MPTSRRCRRCHYHVPRRLRLCRVCGTLNLRLIDYLLLLLLLAGLGVIAWRGAW